MCHSCSREGSNDYAGISLGWGQPFDSVEDQVVTEFFYRFQVNHYFAITPNLQLLVNPANNPEDDRIWVFGLRLRVTS